LFKPKARLGASGVGMRPRDVSSDDEINYRDDDESTNGDDSGIVSYGLAAHDLSVHAHYVDTK